MEKGRIRTWLDAHKWPWLVGGFLLNALFTSALMPSIQERLSMPMLIQRIEWVRITAATLPVCDQRILAYAPVIAEVTTWNLRIVHEQMANKVWWSDWLSPDQWLSIPLIRMPICKGGLGN